MSDFTFKPKFLRPGANESDEIERREVSQGAGECIHYNRFMTLPLTQQRQRLPVFQYRNHILYMLEKYSTLVVVGETGCGKSTQIPQYLHESGWSKGGRVICVTQPRRIATVTVATRVAEEQGVYLGREVGYAIRFEDCTDKTLTRIKFVTDGLLIREMMADPLLRRYSVVMLDEAHERTINTDVVIGLLKKIQKKRPELKIIISSATLDAEAFRDFFNSNTTDDTSLDTASILSIEGRMFPVDIHYTADPVPDYIKAAVDTVFKIHQNEKRGDILVFLTGQEEVETAVNMTNDYNHQLQQKLMPLPMYGGLPPGEQLKVFKKTPENMRKVIYATNIAEASITIDGVVYVVDCGFVKLKMVLPNAGMESLVIVPISKASAKQRAGRAGRVRSGKAYRLLTEKDYEKLLSSATVPEMQRVNLSAVVIQLKALGIDNVLRFDFLSPPPAKNMIRSLELLYALEALDDYGRLTLGCGNKMAELPVDPMLGKMLLSSSKLECSEEILTITAMLQVQNIFYTPPKRKAASDNARRKFAVYEGDHLTLLNVYKAFMRCRKSSKWCQENYLNYKALTKAVAIRERLKVFMKKFKLPLISCDDDPEAVCKCLVTGFFANAAKYCGDGCYRTIRDNHVLHIHPNSVLYTEEPPKWVIFHEVLQTKKDYMRDITVIEPSWLYELAPHYYEYGTDLSRRKRKADESNA
ncbi:putative ATP-dependent RNA helicase DHX35 [Trichoplax sp. H2]|nr:putative ATP-dependent RNA helicase DHX35 [Trichoplax sp. H2]|eukprot:RDD44132.1 putative ATP-dependent RNA helicase DHX35 [Trichoplax sp. H2]